MGKKALDFDPLSVGAWQYLEAFLMMSRDFPGAREASRHALAIDPADELALAYLGYTELLDHKYNDALAVFQKIQGEDVCTLCLRLGGIAMVEHSLGHADESRRALDEVITKSAGSGGYQIAEAYAWRGETDKAFEWLERSYRQRDGGLSQLKTDPLLGSLRSDPRYKAMLAQLKLPE
jgi:tetratricopeptide (TPR) repeat protein